MTEGLGFGKRRLIEEIVLKNWNLKKPEEKSFNYNELLFVIQEMLDEEGKKYFEKRVYRGGHKVFKHFVKHLLYRNLANYDSMILITSEKGTGKSSAAIMMARAWCLLLGIRFNPARHIAYNNADVMRKIDQLNRFEPLICVTGDSRIMIKKDGKYKSVMIKHLTNMKDYKVLSYNIKNNKFEYQKPTTGAVYTKKDIVYEVEFENGKTITATKEHKFLTKNRGYVKLLDLNKNDEIISYSKKCIKIKKITKKSKRKVYDIVGMPNGNFVCNYSPVIKNCDEAIRFACLVGDTKIKTSEGLISIKDLENKKDFKVYSYNEETKKEELQIAEKCVKVKEDIVYEIKTEDGRTIQATKEHKFLTTTGWKKLEELNEGDDLINKMKIKSIKEIGIKPVFDIINVKNNNNYIANSFVVHNSAAEWAKRENKELKKKLAQVRTKHLLYILCFPLKIYKLEKTYLESYTNYWIDLFGRGQGAIYVKDKNPTQDSWRLKEFSKIGSYTEFTILSKVEKQLKKHPNFWQLIKFPKPPAWLYTRYLKVRESNIYDDENVLANVSKQDIHNALLILALRDIMTHDVNINMGRIILHLRNEYDITLSKAAVQAAVQDAKQLVAKVREQATKV